MNKTETFEAVLAAIRHHAELSDEDIIEAHKNGAAVGWPGFTYYKDTVEFYDKNEELIWELLSQTAEDMGGEINDVIESFKTKYQDLSTFKNVLAWFALEEVGYWLSESKGAQNATL